MQYTTVIVCAVLVAGVFAHDHTDQMPFDYIKYPYPVVYPGIDEGTITPPVL
jgi:hypothetical protein